MDEDGQLVRVFIPDVNAQKCVVVNPNDTVLAAKEVILDRINQELPNNRLNYSLYLPSTGSGKLGKFMDDGRVLMEYSLSGTVPRLEMRYKKRDYTIQVSLTEKAIQKANSKANQKKFVEYVTSGSTKKVGKFLEAGIDPNYITEDGNTPLGIACGRGGNVNCIMQILSNGGHIDFRGKDGLTPMHRAAIGGNTQAVNVLMSYGAALEYRDTKGLTPLYHTAIMGDNTDAAVTLLRNRAQSGVKDHGGWTELHQTSKYGHLEHAELFIRYGVDINAQNLVGNTPLHVACSHGQVDCAMLLLKRGADKSQLNFSSQSPSQVSILCGHHQLATDIAAFNTELVEPVKFPGDYNPNARLPTRQLYANKPTSEVCPISPPAELLVNSLTQEWARREVGSNPSTGEAGPKLFNPKLGPGRPGSATSKSSAVRVPDNESISSLDQDSTHSSSTAGTPGQTTPVYPRKLAFQQQREQLYRAVQGQGYVAVQDVDPQQPGDIALRRGDNVEVIFIGKGGYWEGKAGGSEGWFPRLAISEVGSEYETYDNAQTPTSNTPNPGSRKISTTPSISEEPQQKVSSIREVVITRSSRGFGFAMRGVRATKAMMFHPTPEVPALQYVGSVEKGGSADEAGLKTGDFIIEVNGYNVTYCTHDEVVDIVKKSGGVLRMKIITPLIKPKSHSEQIRSQLTPVSTPEVSKKANGAPHTAVRSGSIAEEYNTTVGQQTSNYHPDRETVIGNESPIITHIARSGWDSSSQSQGDESPNTFSSSNFSYHVPAASTVAPPSPISYVKNYPLSQVKSYPITSHGAGPSIAPASQYLPVAGVSQTMPILPKPDYPKLSDYRHDSDTSSGDDEHDSSEFAQQLRKSREKMAERQSLVGMPMPRHRSQTNPNDCRNLTRNPSDPMASRSPSISPQSDEVMSPLAQEILKANRDRKERILLNQPRMTIDSDVIISQQPVGYNPLANAMSQKIDKMLKPHEAEDNRASWDDDSPRHSPHRVRLHSLPRKMPDVANLPSRRWSKEPPPAVKPKPARKPSLPVHNISPESPATIKEEEEEERIPSPPWKTQLKSTPTKSLEKKPLDVLSPEVMKPKPSPAVARKPKRPGQQTDQQAITGQQTDQQAIAQQPGQQTDQQAITGQQTWPKEAVDSPEYPLPPPLPPSQETSVPLSSDELPPPPAAFIIEGVEEGESTTDDILPPPPPPTDYRLTDPHSPSPAPPPPPQTSPPSQLPTIDVSGQGEVFVFPETSPAVVTEPDVDLPDFEAQNVNSSLTSPSLPSPIPSPTIKRSSRFSSSPIPPPDFENEAPSEDKSPPAPQTNVLPIPGPTEEGSLASDTSDAPPPIPSDPPPLDLDAEDQSEPTVETEVVVPREDSQGGEEDVPVVKEKEAESHPPPRPPLPVHVLEDDEPIERKVSGSSSIAIDDKVSSEPSDAEKSTETSSYSARPVTDWGLEEVCAWLKDIGLGEHCDQFTENEIVGEHLSGMSKDDLKELGVKKLGHQKTFAAKIAALTTK